MLDNNVVVNPLLSDRLLLLMVAAKSNKLEEMEVEGKKLSSKQKIEFVLKDLFHHTLSLKDCLHHCFHAYMEARQVRELQITYGSDDIGLLELLYTPTKTSFSSKHFFPQLTDTLTVEDYLEMMINKILSELRFTACLWCKDQLQAVCQKYNIEFDMWREKEENAITQ